MSMQYLYPLADKDITEVGKIGEVLGEGGFRCEGKDGEVVDFEERVEVADADAGVVGAGGAGVGDDYYLVKHGVGVSWVWETKG